MDIKQNSYEANQTVNHSTIQTNFKNRFKDISSIDSLTEYAINSLTEQSPSYFYEYEKALTKEIRNYGDSLIQECKNGTLLKLSDEAIGEAVENRIGDTLDTLCVLNHEHFKAGIRFGSLLMMQLLF